VESAGNSTCETLHPEPCTLNPELYTLHPGRALSLNVTNTQSWQIRKIGVIGPGIVGMPMAAMLADAAIKEGSDTPARVVVLQRASATSGWKVEAINQGRSPIGGVEPDLDRIVKQAHGAGLLSATHDIADLKDADVILVCVQTDKKGIEPDYGPLFEALEGLARVLKEKPAGNVPLIIFESTLAPSSMTTVIRAHFAHHGLQDGKDILLGNSPNRVMPGRLVERVAQSDKIVAGLLPVTAELIRRLYARIVTQGTLHPTNSLTAEVVKTLENAYRDVRIAFSSEVARWCDEQDIDFYQLRQTVNQRLDQSDTASGDPNAVPSGGLLIPTVGVGGHCLPKDGILLWWRLLESKQDTGKSLILEARQINDESPAATIALAERKFGSLAGKRVALLGTAYRFNSEDTRNSPTLPLARLLLDRGAQVTLHDPYVYERDQNLAKAALTDRFTRDLAKALDGAEVIFFCTGHKVYLDEKDRILATAGLIGLVDGCNLLQPAQLNGRAAIATGIGRGKQAPGSELVAQVERAFRAVETGVANEVGAVTDYLNRHYAADQFNRVQFSEVQRIAGTCVTGCSIADRGTVAPAARGFQSRLVERAAG
jgi:UDP-N-acetyl-D-mannosaminuronic acid dehydrogenase